MHTARKSALNWTRALTVERGSKVLATSWIHSNSGKRHILVVDDEPGVRQALGRQLRALGYVTHLAGDAATAIAIASDVDCDVVLTDLLMPHIDGIELMSVLSRSSAITSFVLMTGARDLANHDSKAIAGRLTTVLSKPGDKQELAMARIFS